MDLFQAFYYNDLDISTLNFSHITFIPKKGAGELKDFRSISFLNIPYKIIVETLSNRLIFIISKLVDPS